MMTFVITVHVIVCLLLITVTLIQSGRGTGLVEGFSGLESMLGTQTNAFLARATIVLSIIFFFTCLSLAFLSLQQSRSLMKNVESKQAQSQPVAATPLTGPVGLTPSNTTK
jgi:preprotein translocase subunit SecG